MQEVSATVQMGFDKGLTVCGQQARNQCLCVQKSPQIPSFEIVIKDGPGEKSLQRKEIERLTGAGVRVSGCALCFAVLGANNKITTKSP